MIRAAFWITAALFTAALYWWQRDREHVAQTLEAPDRFRRNDGQ